MDEFTAVVAMAADPALQARVTGCIAVQTTGPDQPAALMGVHITRICAEPGWAQAWMSALQTGVENPGSDPAVISNEQILAAVQKHLGISEATPL